MNTSPARTIAVTRATTRSIVPRGETTRTTSPVRILKASASDGLISTHASGARPSSTVTRPVLVRVRHWRTRSLSAGAGSVRGGGGRPRGEPTRAPPPAHPPLRVGECAVLLAPNGRRQDDVGPGGGGGLEPVLDHQQLQRLEAVLQH